MPPRSAWSDLVTRALTEDLGAGDVTSAATLGADLEVEAVLEARQELVVCGGPLVAHVFHAVEPSLRVERLVDEGATAAPAQALLRVAGRARAVLEAERTALNFAARLCGVATWTRRFVDAVAGTGVRLLDTRKTLPGWRVLDKYAVAVGGGTNHRGGLFDGILVKDNHVTAAGGVGLAVKAVRAHAPPHLRIVVEVESEAQAEEALAAGAEILLLDNRSPEELRGLAARFGDRAQLEASGGITLENVRAVAETGVHRISVGALTHSAPSADVALEVLPGGVRA
jgi:nicotinate-nucleotide pyrophosphorylase (carboxylating)